MTERKLAAILSADVVGYSRLMAQDEDETVRTLGAYREEIELHLRQHRGRLVDFTGDNFLAEFRSAVEALRCAVEIQRVLRAMSENTPSQRQMQFRMGLHLGDVRVEGERLFGTGVNVAARLESLADPGGLCISGAVHEQVESLADLVFDDLGEQDVKNIPRPVRAYRVRTGARVEPRRSPRQRRLVPVVLGLVGVLALAAWFLAPEAEFAAPPELTVPGFGDRGAIAVLPFDNMSGDPDQEYFADGIAEDLITRLSLERSMPVIARNSSFTYKGRPIDVKQVGRELGVRYVVEGSVRRSGDQVRINAQLIDATNGHHIWAETYDRELRDVFALQDEITTAITVNTRGALRVHEEARASVKNPSGLSAWEASLRGDWNWRKLTAQANSEARRLYTRALELDPRLAHAAAGIAVTYYHDLAYQWSADPEAAVAALQRYAQQAVSIDPEYPRSYIASAISYSVTGDREKMLAAARRIIELNPSLAQGYLLLGVAIGISGDPDEGIALLEKALRLSPRDPETYLFFDSLAYVYFAAGRYVEAVEWETRALELEPGYSFGHLLVASSQAQLGRLDQAAAALEAALRLQPTLSVAAIERVLSIADRALIDSFLDGLRKAGWDG